LEEFSFGPAGKVWICTACYNNVLLREQIGGKFRALFADLAAGHPEAGAKIMALARQYKLPEPAVQKPMGE